METTNVQPTLETESQHTARATRLPISSNLKWGAIFGGAVAALGIATMLYALGLALGLAWIEPNDPGSLRPTGIFSGVWSVVVSLIALFVGGYVAARGANAPTRGLGALHGLVMWGLTVVAGAWLVGNVASAIIGGGVAAGKVAAEAVAGAMPSPGQLGGLTQQLGINSNEMLAPVNERLRGAGKPEVTAAQLENATKDVLQRSAREGRLDRDMLIQAITANTALSRTDAEQVAAEAEARFQAARADMKRELASASRTALAAAEDSSKAFWALFGALLLGMLSAIGGAIIGGDRGQRTVSREATPPRPRRRDERPTEAYP